MNYPLFEMVTMFQLGNEDCLQRIECAQSSNTDFFLNKEKSF